MPYFEDLQPCTAFPGTWRNLLAVGWLSKDHAFTKGPVEAGLLNVGYWIPPAAPPGSRQCELCGDVLAPRVSRALFVPGDGVLYVAPGLLRHYVRKHGYQPPAAFLAAVKRRLGYPEYQEEVERYLVEPAPKGEVPGALLPLTDFDAIRLRPGMYLGSTGSTGLQSALLEVVGNSFDEFLAGAATRISVDIDERGWATVEDDGRGFPLELIEPALLQLHSGATLDGHHPHVHVRSSALGSGLAPVNAVSERLELETRRDGVAHLAVFSRGLVVEPVRQLGPTDAKGTRIRFLFDDEIFDDGVQFDLEAIERALETLAWLAPRLDLRFQDKSLQKPEGLVDWLRHLAPNVVSSTVLTRAENVDGVDVEVAFGWQPRVNAPVVRAFVNYMETDDSRSSNRDGLINAVRTFVRAKRASKEKAALNGLVAIVHVRLLEPKFGGPTKARLEMKGVEKAVQQVVTRAMNAAPQWWHSLHEAIR